MDNFQIGQIFDGVYPPEAAMWCNENGAFIEALMNNKFEIKAINKLNIIQLKNQKLKQTESEFTSAISIITPYYTADEKDTFYKQESQAKYYLTEKEAGREPDVTKITHISAIAQERGVTLDEIVAKIMAKVSAFEIASGRLMGVKQKVEDMVEKVNNEEELNSINPHDIIYTVLNNIIEKMSK